MSLKSFQSSSFQNCLASTIMAQRTATRIQPRVRQLFFQWFSSQPSGIPLLKCVDKIAISIYLKWRRILKKKLRKWKEKCVWDRYWCWGPKFSRWSKVSRPGSHNQGKISRSHSSELSWKRLPLQYVAASGQDESPTLAHRAQAKPQKPSGKEEFTLWLGN